MSFCITSWHSSVLFLSHPILCYSIPSYPFPSPFLQPFFFPLLTFIFSSILSCLLYLLAITPRLLAKVYNSRGREEQLVGKWQPNPLCVTVQCSVLHSSAFFVDKLVPRQIEYLLFHSWCALARNQSHYYWVVLIFVPVLVLSVILCPLYWTLWYRLLFEYKKHWIVH